jgi:sortase A
MKRALEWFFLLIGLILVDCYVWVNTGALLYQAYQDWAFDQTLRGLAPRVPLFIADEIAWLFGASREGPDAPDAPTRLEPLPASKAPLADAVVGRLLIPRLELMAMVREGADESTLRRAVGHIPGTALPGRIGNVGLAGHRDTFFRALAKIRNDDVIDLETQQGTYRYQVVSTKIVGPRDLSVLAASGGETLTLVTCFPFRYIGSAPQRFIVRATQITAAKKPSAG